jgi:hypothetical protein
MITGSSDPPSSVSSYTFDPAGGGNVARRTIPSPPSVLSLFARRLVPIPGSPSRRSLNRLGPVESSRTKSSVHRSPTTSSALATVQYCP